MRTSVSPSKSIGSRRFGPIATKTKPESVGAVHAITADPSSMSSVTSLQMRSRVLVEYDPTYTPARISASHRDSRPRSRGGAFSTTMTIIARSFLG